MHPYAEVESAAALEHEFVTLCGAEAANSPRGLVLGLTDAGDSWGITGKQGGKSLSCQLGTVGEIPTITF